MAKKKRLGTIHEKGSVFLCNYVGEANKGTDHYELYNAGMIGGSPIIRSKQTGRYFVLTWKELIAMAIEAGIDSTPVFVNMEGSQS